MEIKIFKKYQKRRTVERERELSEMSLVVDPRGVCGGAPTPRLAATEAPVVVPVEVFSPHSLPSPY